MARSKKIRKPLTGLAQGPDAKGRFFLEAPETGKKLLFYGGAPGEQSRVRRGRKGRRGEQGDLLEVLEPVSTRRHPPCRHFGVCGGCTLQHLPEEYALELKSAPHYEMLRRSFPEAELLLPVSSPRAFAYRTKVELTFMEQPDGTTSLGFHRRGRFDRGVDVGRCWLSPLPSSLLAGLRQWMKRWGLKGWNPRSHQGDLRYLIYRYSFFTQRDLLALVINGQADFSDDCMAHLVEVLKREGISGALIISQTSVAGAVVPDETRPLFGPQLLTEKLGELRFELGWQSFFQVNPPAYERLLETMSSWRLTPPGKRVLDLFCGVGSIGLSLYREGDRLTGVELVEQAVRDARENASRNGVEAEFEVRTAEDWDQFETDLLILDPPRSGCHPRLIERLTKEAPAEELLYVSCNPHRLSEELPQLATRYRLLRAQAFDFFPQTHHCELLLQLVRRES